MSFVPEFQGQIRLEHLPDDFVERIARRVETGLLVPNNRTRANYRVLASDRDSISFAAEGFFTQYNVGLNRVTVRRADASQLDYQCVFWGWTGYALAHGAVMGLLFVAVYALSAEIRREIATRPLGPAMFWSLVGFFSLLWPWLLAVIHRGTARQVLERILRETMASPGGGEALAKRP